MLGDKLPIDIPIWVAPYIGIPFEELNCWQLICLIYDKQFNLKIPTYVNEYKNACDKNNIKKIYEREFKIWRKITTPALGDVVVLRVEGQPWHAGLVVSTKYMLHTQIGINSAIESYNGIIWKNRVIGYYRYAQNN